MRTPHALRHVAGGIARGSALHGRPDPCRESERSTKQPTPRNIPRQPANAGRPHRP